MINLVTHNEPFNISSTVGAVLFFPLVRGEGKEGLGFQDDQPPTSIYDRGLILSYVPQVQADNVEEEKVEKKITELRGILEDYANGGFDIIRAKKESDPAYFLQNENCFIDLLEA